MENISKDELNFSQDEDIKENSWEIIDRLSNDPPAIVSKNTFPDFTNQTDNYQRPAGITLQILTFGKNKSMPIRIFQLDGVYRYSLYEDSFDLFGAPQAYINQTIKRTRRTKRSGGSNITISSEETIEDLNNSEVEYLYEKNPEYYDKTLVLTNTNPLYASKKFPYSIFNLIHVKDLSTLPDEQIEWKLRYILENRPSTLDWTRTQDGHVETKLRHLGDTHPYFLAWLHEIFPNYRDLARVQEELGILILNRVAPIIPVHVGFGSNGKSMLSDHINYCFEGLVTKQDLFDLAEDKNYARNEIRGKTVNISAEMNYSNVMKSIAFIKRMTGDKKLTGRGIYNDPWTEEVGCTPMVMGNYLPRIKDQDIKAFWSRLRFFTHNVIFKRDDRKKEQIDEKLKQPDEVLSFILFAVAGLIRYLNRGTMIFDNPDDNKRAKENMKLWDQYSNPILIYVNEKIKVTGDMTQVMTANDIWQNAKNFFDEKNLREPERQTFFKSMKYYLGDDYLKRQQKINGVQVQVLHGLEIDGVAMHHVEVKSGGQERQNTFES
jgi:hypothetical protein